MKVLRSGQLSIYDSSPWRVGEWREDLTAKADGKACGQGFHCLLAGDPLQSPVFCLPAEVWRVEAEDELSRDATKARYRRMRIVEDVTANYPIVVALNEFAVSIPSIRWLRPRGACPWMQVQECDSVAAIRAVATGLYLYSPATIDVARNAEYGVAWYADAGRVACWSIMTQIENVVADEFPYWKDPEEEDVPYWKDPEEEDVPWGVTKCARDYALSLMVADLDIDTTWLRRWWLAWERGYYPLYERDDMLVVGAVDLAS